MSSSRVTLDAETHAALQIARLSLDRAKDAIFFIDIDAKFFYANDAACSLLGYDRDELLNLRFYDVEPNFSAESWQRHWQSVRDRGSTTIDSILQPKTGDRLSVNTNINYLNFEGKEYHCAIVRDVTESKQAAQNLYRAKEQLKVILDAVPGFVSWISKDGRYLQVNRHLADSYGMPPEAFIGKELGFLQSSPQFADFVHNFISSPHSGSSQIVEADVKGVRRYYLIAAQKSQEGDSSAVVGIDITERKQAAEELQRSKDHLRAVLDAVPGFVSWIAKEGYYLGVNRHLADSYGMPPEAFIGKELGFLKNSPQFVDFVRHFINSAENGASQVIEADVKDSKRYYLIAAQKYDSGNAAVAVGIDMTQRKRATEALKQSEAQLREQAEQLETALIELRRTQSQLIQAEKMSALGQTVAGIAHEINNPINFIYGNLDHAQQYARNLLELIALYQNHYPKPHPEIYEKIDAIEFDFLQGDLLDTLRSMRIGADRIHRLMVSLRNFARLDESAIKVADLHPGIESTLVILNHRLKNIKLSKDYGDLPPITCYPALLNQVWLHLIANAIDALEDISKKGDNSRKLEITIKTEAIDDTTVCVRIRDNGTGIPTRVKNKIFDPFFTTKAVGKGTGLGLSICYQAVEEHGGEIIVDSSDRGTEFKVLLPVRL